MLTLPPGLTLDQIADRVGQLPGHSQDAFLARRASGAIRSKYQPPSVTSLEGLLFPDTYFIGATRPTRRSCSRLVATFDQQADADRAREPPRRNRLDARTRPIVAASLIETEAKLAEDRR